MNSLIILLKVLGFLVLASAPFLFLDVSQAVGVSIVFSFIVGFFVGREAGRKEEHRLGQDKSIAGKVYRERYWPDEVE